MLIENRCTTHAELIKNNRNIVILKPGNIVIARIAIKFTKKRERF